MVILKYIIAITLMLGWIIGYFVFNSGKDIHLLFGMAVMASSAIIAGKKDSEKKELI